MTRSTCATATLSIALLVVAASNTAPTTAAQAGPPATAQAQGGDANELFEKMFPVFTHARCINCHGVVQSAPGNIRSVTGDTHPGEEQGDSQQAADCGVCHDETPEVEAAWQFTAPDHMSWVGKDVNQLCAMQAEEVEIFNRAARGRAATLRGSYLNHLTTDPLITQALVSGRAGGAFASTKPSDRPPMTRADFLAAATAWVDAGAPCRATGSITQVERLQTTYTYPYAAGINGLTAVQERATRMVQVMRLPDRNAVADTTMRGHQTITIKYGEIAPRGPCSVTMIADSDWISTSPGIAPADVALRLKDGSYEIEFTLKPDKTQQTSSGTSISDCGLPNMNSGPDRDDELEWEPWKFTIRCPATFTQDGQNYIRCDPRQHEREPRVSGELFRTIIGQEDATEPQSWLHVSPAGTSRADNGDPLPITIRTTWNLATR